MKRLMLGSSVAAALLLAAPPAFAAGFNLMWQTCFGEGLHTSSNRNFACDTNDGTNIMVVSFILAADLPQVSGNEVTMDFLSQTDPLPAWWDMKDVGTCRPAALGFDLVANANDVVCLDWAQGQSTGGIGAYNTTGTVPDGHIDPSLTARHRRLKMAIAVPQSGIQDLVAATEYFAVNLKVSNIRTVGTGACAGCTDPVCIVLNSLKVTTPVAEDDVYMTNPSSPGSNIITWQGTGPDCLLVPTRKATWGDVKALYR